MQIQAFLLYQETSLQHYAKNRCEPASTQLDCRRFCHVACEQSTCSYQQTSFALAPHSQGAKLVADASSSDKYYSIHRKICIEQAAWFTHVCSV
jgi:hypothetical protein